MNYTDRWVKDSEGNEFIFTVEMQRRLSQAGLPVEPDEVYQLGSQPSKPAPVEMKERKQEEPDGPETIQIDPISGKYIGRLKWFSPAKGYGFINRGGGEDIFFHKSAVAEEELQLEEGTWVLYDVEERKKGMEATDVERYERD